MVEGIEQRFFEKGAHGSTPAYLLSDFDKGLFRTVGQIFSASLAEGGPSPNFITDWCYHYLCLGQIKSEDWTKADVSDANYTDLISKIEAAAELELHELANDVFGCGYSGLISGGKKDEMIRAVILHANLRLLPILQQMKEGLSLFGLGNIMARHPDICRPLFVPGDEVTVDADYINSILLAEHNEEGSMRRAREVAIMQYFQDFLQELEEG
ncbi:G2/M phase-specific E3 ubiquitin-protein ligase-like [Odontesthes bonariensis]|uniref:G2/M phase-specific E3 ubiquitin-protein ligase-like n=1 Tax=Odontesthes bonariensis TaxID=219752 RepID=UPI003F586DA6